MRQHPGVVNVVHDRPVMQPERIFLGDERRGQADSRQRVKLGVPAPKHKASAMEVRTGRKPIAVPVVGILQMREKAPRHTRQCDHIGIAGMNGGVVLHEPVEMHKQAVVEDNIGVHKEKVSMEAPVSGNGGMRPNFSWS